MADTLRFALQFYGVEAAEQMRAATRALARTGVDDHAVRARLQTILAAARLPIDPDSATAAAREAFREADLAGDDVSRGWALTAAAVTDQSPESLVDRQDKSREALRLAQSSGEEEFVTTAYFLLLGALAELGSIAELDSVLSPTGPVLSQFPWLEYERHTAWFRCLRATLDGQVEAAEQLANQAYALAQRHEDLDGQSVWVGQLAIIRWMQGRVTELEPTFLFVRQLAPHEPVWAVSLAWMWLQQGRKSAARALIAAFPPVKELPRDRNWLATACILATVAAELREHEIARTVREVLLPYEQRLVTIGLGVTCWGTVSRPLALVAELLGDTEAAIAHYRTAVQVAARTGAHPWLAEAQWELAALLADHGGPADLDEALSLADEAAATGRILQLHGIEESAATVRSSLQRRREPRPVVPRLPADASLPQVRVLGGFEVCSVDGTVARWRSRKARELIKILVARRGSAVGRETVMDLMWPNVSPDLLANRFAVAATTVRRALDPEGTLPGDFFLETRGGLVRLRDDRIEIDVDRFLAEAQDALDVAFPLDVRARRLTAVLEIHRGEALADEPDAAWAVHLRRDVHNAFFAAAHALADASGQMGDQVTRLETYRRILVIDNYDQRAHEGLVDALTALGAHGQAAEASGDYRQRMLELGLGSDMVESPEMAPALGGDRAGAGLGA